MSSWKLVGINDDSTECDVCGRIELKSTMHLVAEDGSELRAGSSCGARKLGTTTKRMNDKVKAYRMHEEVRRTDWYESARRRFGCAPTAQSVARKRGFSEDLSRTLLMNDWKHYCETHPITIAV